MLLKKDLHGIQALVLINFENIQKQKQQQMNFVTQCYVFCLVHWKENQLVKIFDVKFDICSFKDDEDNMTWPEVLKYMFECANSPDSGLRSCALHIFG